MSPTTGDAKCRSESYLAQAEALVATAPEASEANEGQDINFAGMNSGNVTETESDGNEISFHEHYADMPDMQSPAMDENYFSPQQEPNQASQPGFITPQPTADSAASSTSDLLALHSQLKNAATDKDKKDGMTAPLAQTTAENGDNASSASQKESYQDDLYRRDESETLVPDTAQSAIAEDVTSDHGQQDNSAYFSAEGFLHEQQAPMSSETEFNAPTTMAESGSPRQAPTQEYAPVEPEPMPEPVTEPVVIAQAAPVAEVSACCRVNAFCRINAFAESMPVEEPESVAESAPANEQAFQPESGSDNKQHNNLPEQASMVPENFDAYALPEWITFEQANAVSVDFEIPFKLNGKKVLKASQLDTWAQLIEQSGIGALTKQLVLHSNYIKKDDVVELVIAEQQKHLLNDATIKTIEEGLSAILQQQIRLEITVGEVIDTPWAVQRAINNMRQEHAEKTIQEDTTVAQLCQQFSGTVLKETIKPR